VTVQVDETAPRTETGQQNGTRGATVDAGRAGMIGDTTVRRVETAGAGVAATGTRVEVVGAAGAPPPRRPPITPPTTPSTTLATGLTTPATAVSIGATMAVTALTIG
jgi:hypothetical protein